MELGAPRLTLGQDRKHAWNWTLEVLGTPGPEACGAGRPSSLMFINSDRWRSRTQSTACTAGVLDLPDCCQHPLKAHKNKLSIGLPVGKIDSVHPTVASISSDRVPVTLP